MTNNSLRSQKQKPVKKGMDRKEALKDIVMMSGVPEDSDQCRAILGLLGMMDDKMFKEAYRGIKHKYNEENK